jgi:hypothetical protein
MPVGKFAFSAFEAKYNGTPGANNCIEGNIGEGVYRVILKGGSGGRSGANSKGGYYNGGAGAFLDYVFIVNTAKLAGKSSVSFELCAGETPTNGGTTIDPGSGGAGSWLMIGDEYFVAGGGAGGRSEQNNGSSGAGGGGGIGAGGTGQHSGRCYSRGGFVADYSYESCFHGNNRCAAGGTGRINNGGWGAHVNGCGKTGEGASSGGAGGGNGGRGGNTGCGVSKIGGNPGLSRIKIFTENGGPQYQTERYGADADNAACYGASVSGGSAARASHESNVVDPQTSKCGDGCAILYKLK